MVLRNALRGIELGKCWEQSSVEGAKKLPPWENENIYNKDIRKQDSEKHTEIQIE